MSVNYHAFQSRGFLFSEYETVCEQWCTAFAGLDPGRLCRILHLEADEAFLYVTYFGRPYRLRLADGHLEKRTADAGSCFGKQGGGWTERLYFNEAMAIYHLLYYTKDIPTVSGQWTPSHSIDGVVSRSSRVPDPLLGAFCREWAGRVPELTAACERLGGQRLDKGDVSFQFEAFPCVMLQLVFWDGDEDFPPQTQIFVDRMVTDFVHFETVGCIISDLMELLSQSDGAD